MIMLCEICDSDLRPGLRFHANLYFRLVTYILLFVLLMCVQDLILISVSYLQGENLGFGLNFAIPLIVTTRLNLKSANF